MLLFIFSLLATIFQDNILLLFYHFTRDVEICQAGIQYYFLLKLTVH